MAWAAVAAAAVGVVGGAMTSRNSGGNTAPAANNMPAMTPEQQAAMTQLIARLTGRTNATSPYGGQLSTGLTPGMGRSLAALEAEAMGTGGPGGSDEARGTLSRAMKDDGSDINDVFTNSVENPEIKRFNERTMPALLGSFRGNAAFGSDRRNAELKAGQDLNDTLVGARSSMAFNAKEAAKERALKAAGMVPGMDAQRMDALFKLFGAQSGSQAIDQVGLDRNYGEFIRQQKGDETNINQILSVLGLNPVNTVVTPGQSGFLTAAAPGFGNAAAQYLGNYLTKPRSTSSSSPTIDPGGYDGAGGYYGG